MDEVVHPVIRTHPETGRKALYVNDMFTLRIQGMSKAVPRAARLFFIHATCPEFCCRFAGANAVAIWDNRYATLCGGRLSGL